MCSPWVITHLTTVSSHPAGPGRKSQSTGGLRGLLAIDLVPSAEVLGIMGPVGDGLSGKLGDY